MTMETGSQKCHVAGFENEERGHEPRNVGSLEGGKDKEMDSFLEPPERDPALQTP